MKKILRYQLYMVTSLGNQQQKQFDNTQLRLDFMVNSTSLGFGMIICQFCA
ncbi:unnamed protein product [Paramecium octaurelia]|uniref:Uncharacterized protein n=1 Tax=Paramecium octaurelia TaxID=43137 RepID=A0A8S1SVB9_PAROT|nr:unnamed protein product [Paramecium octaurelia]